jgi:predicted nucleic acid-binding protein
VKLVLDASFALAWLAREPAGPVLAEFEARVHAGQAELHAPELFLLETGNALWKSIRRQMRTVEEGVAMFESIRELPIRLHRHRDLALESLDLALRRGISVYDASYVAVAVREVLPLFTIDKRLAAAVDDLIDVVSA